MGYALFKQGIDDPETVLVKIFNTEREAKDEQAKLSKQYDWDFTIQPTQAKSSREYFGSEPSYEKPRKYW